MSVSICLPTLHAARFLDARIESICCQSCDDFEVVAVDSYSEDGTWERLQAWAASDMRVRLIRAPREGIYAAINTCIRLSKNKYIYIATADDTMAPDCLSKMVSALTKNPDCGMAQCGLRYIDAASEALPEPQQWTHTRACRFFGDWMSRGHVREAPLDGILHYALTTVYTSLTQLLICRTVFEHAGYFPLHRGPEGDFEWAMRAALQFSVVYVPENLATWRKHEAQATRPGRELRTRLRLASMCDHVRRESIDDLLPTDMVKTLRMFYFRDIARETMKQSMPLSLFSRPFLTAATRYPGLIGKMLYARLSGRRILPDTTLDHLHALANRYDWWRYVRRANENAAH